MKRRAASKKKKGGTKKLAKKGGAGEDVADVKRRRIDDDEGKEQVQEKEKEKGKEEEEKDEETKALERTEQQQKFLREVADLKAGIRKKKSWIEKLQDAQIKARYIEEAVRTPVVINFLILIIDIYLFIAFFYLLNYNRMHSWPKAPQRKLSIALSRNFCSSKILTKINSSLTPSYPIGPSFKEMVRLSPLPLSPSLSPLFLPLPPLSPSFSLPLPLSPSPPRETFFN